MFLSSAGFGYGATLEGGSTSPEFSAADTVELVLVWNDRGEISASCEFIEPGPPWSRRFHGLNLRRLLRRDAGEVGVVPVVGVPVGAQAAIRGEGCQMKNRRIEQFRDLMRRKSVPVPGETDDAERGDGATGPDADAPGNAEEVLVPVNAPAEPPPPPPNNLQVSFNHMVSHEALLTLNP